MAVYMIIQTLEINDEAMYKEYASKAKPIIESFGGRYLASSENVRPISKDWTPQKMLIIEFPSEQVYDECMNSPQYQDIIHLRKNSLKSSAVLVPSL